MLEMGVELQRGIYDIPLHKQKVWLGEKVGEYPNSEHFSKYHIDLPIWRGMPQGKINYVIEKVKETLDQEDKEIEKEDKEKNGWLT